MKTNIGELTEEQMKALDIIIVVDHSGSMGEASTRLAGKTKMEEMEEDVEATARIAEKYDDDGLTVIAFASAVSTYDGVKADKVRTVFKEFPPRGSTDLAAALGAAAQKTTESKKVSTVALVYTDGAPNDKTAVVATIKSAAKKLGRPKFGMVLVQIGNDSGATEFLEYLDNELQAQGVPDIVATVKEADAESLSLPQLCWLALNA